MAESLWDFSLDFYGRPGVSAACIALQDWHDRDVNLILFAVYVGASGRGAATPALLDQAEALAEPWAAQVVRPLRAVRRWLKENGPELYAEVKRVELDAERMAQARLETLLPPGRADTDPRTDALLGLSSYLGETPIPHQMTEALDAWLAQAGRMR